MTYKIIKYGLLTLLTLLSAYQLFSFGDYCSGLSDIFAFVFFVGLFFLAFLIFIIIDFLRTMKRKIKFDYSTLIFLGIFLTINFLLLNIETEKFWTKTILVGQIDVGDLRGAQLKLYDNQTFSVSTSYVAYSCTYQGVYSIKNDTLILKRVDLPDLTNKVFKTRYVFWQSDSLLIPIDNEYQNIKIKKVASRMYD